MKTSSIQWCDSTNNPIMGCVGCELWPTLARLVTVILAALQAAGLAVPSSLEVRAILEGMAPTDAYHARKRIARAAVAMVKSASRIEAGVRKAAEEAVALAIATAFKCYAGFLHLRHGKDDGNPDKKTNKGYAPKFEQVTRFPGRMREAAGWSDLRGVERPDKPWLGRRLPRLIFVSDMGDLLSPEVGFSYIKEELTDQVSSEKGQRHLWLWLTKQPKRMRLFFEWLEKEYGMTCPENLVCMTSVTSAKTVWRVRELQKVKCGLRGLSVEPLWTAVELPLEGISWVIVGGESGMSNDAVAPFDLAWARDLREQCREAGVAFFVKQLGSNPVENGRPLKLRDGHGGDWDEWPLDLRVREMPAAFDTLCVEEEQRMAA